MTLMPLTTARPSATAYMPPATRDASARETPAASTPSKPAETKTVETKDAEDAAAADPAKERRQAAKAEAKARILQILDRLRELKKAGADNPEFMAKQLAQIAKELKAALKAYAQAGGSAAGWQTSLNAPAPAEPGAPPKDVYEQMKEQVSGSEAAGDMDVLKYAKGIAKTIREELEKARLKLTFAKPDDKTKDAIDETETTLKEVGKAIEDMDRGIKASSPAAGLFVAMYA
ncbi:hypothetical protein sos41_41400 [Alphaproteobacteria bacterium SO-S41]|nr:hypothetical protein sos41_41400 [Alphaproteobacteria bacterium SO-S41]